MKVLRFPSKNDPLTGRLFGQSSVFNYKDRQLLLSALFQVDDQQAYNLRAMERAWEAATAAAFTYREMAGEQLIEKVLTAINEVIKDSVSLIEGAVVIIDGDTINFSTNGTISVVLTEGGSVTIVSGSQHSNEFTAVTSGQVDTEDNIILAAEPICQQLITLQDFSIHQLEEVTENEQSQIIAVIRDQKLIENELTPTSQIPMLLETFRKKFAGGLESLKRGWAHSKNSWQKQKLAKKGEATTNLPKIKIPKLSLPFPLRPITLVALLLFVGALAYGGNIIYSHFRDTTDPSQNQSSLLSELQSQPKENLTSYLAQNFTYQNYQRLSEDDRTQFASLLKEGGIGTMELDLLKEFPEPLVDVAVDSSRTLGLDKTGQLWQLVGESLEKVPQKGLIIDPQRLLVFNSDRILATDALGNIWLFDNTPNQPASLPMPSVLSSGKKVLSKYLSNLYIYHLPAERVYRIPGFDKDVVNQSVYSDLQLVGLSELQDFQVFGDSIAITASGAMRKFSRSVGVGEPISVQVGSNSRVYEQNGAVYHLSSYFLTEYTSELVLKSQMLLLADTPPTGIIFGETGPSIIAAGKNLYRASPQL